MLELFGDFILNTSVTVASAYLGYAILKKT